MSIKDNEYVSQGYLDDQEALREWKDRPPFNPLVEYKYNPTILKVHDGFYSNRHIGKPLTN
jgi:hypothetical protein